MFETNPLTPTEIRYRFSPAVNACLATVLNPKIRDFFLKNDPKLFWQQIAVACELGSKTNPGDQWTKPFKVVLHTYHKGWVVHLMTTDDGGLHHGDYFEWDEHEQALQKFINRSYSNGLKP